VPLPSAEAVPLLEILDQAIRTIEFGVFLVFWCFVRNLCLVTLWKSSFENVACSKRSYPRLFSLNMKTFSFLSCSIVEVLPLGLDRPFGLFGPDLKGSWTYFLSHIEENAAGRALSALQVQDITFEKFFSDQQRRRSSATLGLDCKSCEASA
jgi:hypothetical protein